MSLLFKISILEANYTKQEPKKRKRSFFLNKMRLYEIYEHQAIRAHQLKFGHKTYHWKNLTIKILHDSGWPILYRDMKNWLSGKKHQLLGNVECGSTTFRFVGYGSGHY